MRVTGTKNYDATQAQSSGRLAPGATVIFKPAPDNPHDASAVEVRLIGKGEMLGHVPRVLAPFVGQMVTHVSIYDAKIRSVALDSGVPVIDLSVKFPPMQTGPAPRPVTGGGCYAIINMRNLCFYLGKSRDIKSRIAQHVRDLERGTHESTNFQADWNLYGPNTFVFGKASSDQGDEQALIRRWGVRDPINGYNTTTTGRDGGEQVSPTQPPLDKRSPTNENWRGTGGRPEVPQRSNRKWILLALLVLAVVLIRSYFLS